MSIESLHRFISWELVISGLILSLLTTTIYWFRDIISRFLKAILGLDDQGYSPQEREHRVKWVAQGIDPIIREINRHNYISVLQPLHLEVDSPGPTPKARPLPKLDTIEYDPHILHDISNDGYSVKTEVDSFNEQIESYNERREEIRDLLTEHFYSTSDHMFRPFSDIRNPNTAEKVAELVLLVNEPKHSVGWIGENIDIVRNLVPAVRKKDKFKGEFEELKKIAESIGEKSHEVAEAAYDTREYYTDYYDINESEIAEMREEDNSDSQ